MRVNEKLILQRIMSIEEEMKVDLTGVNQHGFKRKRSTKTAGLSIQSALARAIEQGKFAIMASLDLSSAFDLVNVKVLLIRLRRIGLPADVVNLVEIWLSNRFFYVNAKGNNSYIRLSDIGTVQGSILGPFLYAVYVSPLFDLTDFHAFADDNLFP